MDWFTHIFAAVAFGLAFRARRPVLLALAFGAMAPDLDALLTPITLVAPNLWFLDHRTFSHSLLLGPLWAVGVVWVIQRPAVLRLWRRIFRVDIAMRLGWMTVGPLIAGVYLHMAMDAMTVQGPALLTPFSPERTQLNWFYFIDILPLAVSSILFLLTLVQKGSPKARVGILAVLLISVAATGGLRAFTLANVAGDEGAGAVIPTWNPWLWWAWTDRPNGTVEVSLLESGESGGPTFSAFYARVQSSGVPGPPGDLDRARRIAESTLDYSAFLLNAYTVSLNASRDATGDWRLGYFDPVRRGQAEYTGSANLFSPEDLVITVGTDGTVTAAWP